MKPFEANFTKILTRFYLMMAVILIAGFTGMWAIAILALPLFLSAMLAPQREKKTTPKTKDTKEFGMVNNQFKEVA